jgi:hypothetical protein
MTSPRVTFLSNSYREQQPLSASLATTEATTPVSFHPQILAASNSTIFSKQPTVFNAPSSQIKVSCGVVPEQSL